LRLRLPGIDLYRKNSAGIVWFPSMSKQSGVCRKALRALPHSQETRLKDIDAVDFFDLHYAESPRQRILLG
jgi:hypothetical protein